jgi:hypothetical protein
MAPSGTTGDEEALLTQLHQAIVEAPRRPAAVEIGTALSIALGRRRPAVSCGGCSTPLEVDGIPAETNARLTVPFRLRFADPPTA